MSGAWLSFMALVDGGCRVHNGQWLADIGHLREHAMSLHNILHRNSPILLRTRLLPSKSEVSEQGQTARHGCRCMALYE